VFKIIAVYFAVFITTILGVAIFRRWSLRRKIFDIPNERSSHTEPTPKGGGVVICLVCLSTFFIYTGFSGGNFYWSYFAGAIIVAAVSLIDDIKHISPFIRILFHSLAAGLVVRQLGGFETLYIPFYGVVYTEIFAYILAFLWIVWLINAYNFMDGIDGIAATQAVTAGLGWCLIGLILGVENSWFYSGVLAMSSFGFLLFNWQPAKIFMGDVGSAFLGYSFAVLPLLELKNIENPVIASLIPWIAILTVWFFVFDSVLTFFKRLFRGEKVWQAHREHIYQQMVISGLSHSFVTIVYGSASILLTGSLILFLKYSLSFEKLVLTMALGETILLLILSQTRAMVFDAEKK
jgi:Fuc2NAc and GlcNAc transferase